MEVGVSDTLMVLGGVMFCEVIPQVGFARCPKNAEMSLFDTVAYTIESPVDGSGSLLVDGVVGYAAGCGVVSLNGCGLLWISHFIQCGAYDFSFLAIDE
jgi:hypothetical protein